MENLNPLFRIAELIFKQKTSGLSVSEHEIMQGWLVQNDKNKILYEKLKNGNWIINELNELEKFDSQKAFVKVETQLLLKNKEFRLPAFLKYAAVILSIIGFSYLVMYKFSPVKSNLYTQHIILPGKTKAILIKANNEKIILDSSNNKQLIKDETAQIVNDGSTLLYEKSESSDKNRESYSENTLITPKGGEYTVILSDGTTIMLNADSKLKFPVVFNNAIREVTLEGEAFFKVKKLDKRPFVVRVNNVNITVYGTVFNISAYRNESIVQTTLIEGSVGVNVNDGRSAPETKIKPGQQLTYYTNSEMSETKDVNTEPFIAWTQEMFVFENEPIENILKVMSRWYNFEVDYENDFVKQQRFTISLGRNNDVSKILDMISASSRLKFNIKENKVSVSLK